jgi:hypothetical protein
MSSLAAAIDAPTNLPPGSGMLHILDNTGDTKIIWDSKNEDEVENAKEQFDRLKKKGFLAFSVNKDGSKNKQIHEFDPDAEKIILSPPLVGG